jgi:GTP-binding protein
MSKKIPTVAIVGRTNVGKSTLFNAIAGRRISIVEDTPGVTRDRHYYFVTRFGYPVTIIDTGGMAGEQEVSLEESVKKQTELAIVESDLIVAVLDGLDGVHPLDGEVVDILRRSEKPVLYVVNKCESPKSEIFVHDFYALGVDGLIRVSATHHMGIHEMMEEIRVKLDVPKIEEGDAKTVVAEDTIRVAILGRPNVGKSSIINKILGEERLIASDIPGTTRDAIDITLRRDGKDFIIVDTAGLRKKARVDDATVERYGNLRTLKALARSDVAVLVIDATKGAPSEQDTKIAGLIHERGRPFIVVINKWDAIEKDHLTVKSYEDAVRTAFKFAPYVPVLYVSALTGQRCPKILQKAAEVYANAHFRYKTSDLNKLLKYAFTRRPPPVYRGEPIKLFFATQIGVAPPTIVLFISHPKKLNFSYMRYLKNAIRDETPFEGSDIRLIMRKRNEEEEQHGESE